MKSGAIAAILVYEKSGFKSTEKYDIIYIFGLWDAD